MSRLKLGILFSLFTLLAGFSGFAQESTIPHQLYTPYPTFHNLAIEWTIEGDDNQNGVVTLKYREKGEKEWKEGMPLRRVPAGSSKGTTPIFTWKNRHSGSLFNLKPGTAYELNLKLEDPDGGSVEKRVEAQTREIPDYGDFAEIVELQSGDFDTLFTHDGTRERPVVYRCWFRYRFLSRSIGCCSKVLRCVRRRLYCGLPTYLHVTPTSFCRY